MAAGIPNDLYWELTLQEVGAVLRRVVEQERAANLRAGLIAATIINASPYKPKGRFVRPTDFLAERQHMTAEEGQLFMDSWSTAQNADFKKTPQ